MPVVTKNSPIERTPRGREERSLVIPKERRTTKSGGFLAITRRAGAIFAPSVVVGRLFGMTKLRFLRLAGGKNDRQQALRN